MTAQRLRKERAMNLVILPQPQAARPRRQSRAVAYAVSLTLVATATLAAIVVNQVLSTPNLTLIFVLPVVIAAVTYGFGPALAAAVTGVLACNYFLFPPLYSLNVAEPANIWALFLLLAVAAIVSAVAAHSRRRAVEAWQAADQATALQGLAKSLVAASGREATAKAAAETLSRLFTAPAVVLLDEPDGLKVAARAGVAPLSKADEEAAAWALASRLRTQADAYPVEAAVYDFWPVVTPHRQQAVIGVAFGGREAGRPESAEPLAEAVGAYLAVALDREAYADQAADTRVEVETERLKTDLLSAVSHDLKTPLSTVLITLQSLKKFGRTHDANTRKALLDLAETETARLTAMVGNLLEMSRLDAGAVVVRKAPAPPGQLVVEALDRVRGALEGRRVLNEVTAAQPALLADATLFETALANVLENAGKYAPEGSTIRIRGGVDDGAGWIEVLDEGPGFPGAIEPMFEKFSRGVSGDGRPPGTGLGLAIARGFLEAQGGAVDAENLPGGKGARVRLTAPLAEARAA
jgi:two-component system sensor histidine kinase KdpD